MYDTVRERVAAEQQAAAPLPPRKRARRQCSQCGLWLPDNQHDSLCRIRCLAKGAAERDEEGRSALLDRLRRLTDPPSEEWLPHWGHRRAAAWTCCGAAKRAGCSAPDIGKWAARMCRTEKELWMHDLTKGDWALVYMQGGGEPKVHWGSSEELWSGMLDALPH